MKDSYKCYEKVLIVIVTAICFMFQCACESFWCRK